MHELTPQTPLGAHIPKIESIGDITIEEITCIALASVAARSGQTGKCRDILTGILQGAPCEPGKARLTDAISCFWMGPEQWMLFSELQTHDLLATTLKTAVGATASVTEQSDGWVCFDLRGTKVTDLFERLCPVPVRRMAAGDAQRTTIHHLGCFIICLNPADEIRVLGPRSSAGSLFHALCQAARSVA